MKRVLGLMAAASLASSSAWACTCSNVSATLLYPMEDVVSEVPTTANFWLLDGVGASAERYKVVVDGVEAAVDAVVRETGDYAVIQLVPRERLTANATVEVYDGKRLVGTSVVNTIVDETPPTWGGQYTREVHRGNDGSTCGDSAGVSFFFEDASDDVDPAEALLYVMEPIGEGNTVVGFLGGGGASYNELCGGNDPAMLDSTQRAYEVTVFDGSGNAATETQEVHSGCGCSTGGVAGSWVGVLLLGLLRRRR